MQENTENDSDSSEWRYRVAGGGPSVVLLRIPAQRRATVDPPQLLLLHSLHHLSHNRSNPRHLVITRFSGVSACG